MDAKKDFCKNAVPMFLALVLTSGFFGFVYLLFISNEIPKENAAQLNILLGGIAAVWAKAVSFFYDSSASSKEKDQVIGEIAKSMPITGTGAGNPTTTILNAETVKNETKEGDINVTPTNKEPTP